MTTESSMVGMKFSPIVPVIFFCECATYAKTSDCAHVNRITEMADAACQALYVSRRTKKKLPHDGIWHETTTKWDEQASILAHLFGMPDLFGYQKVDSYLAARSILKELDPETVIDAPSGFGRNISWLRSEGREGIPRKVIAVDFDDALLETVRLYFPDVDTVCTDLGNWYPRQKADLLYLQGLYKGENGPRRIAKHIRRYSDRILIHESEDEFRQDEIETMMEGAGYTRTRHHGPYISNRTKVSTWVSLWEAK